MKKFIKNIAPVGLIKWYRNIKFLIFGNTSAQRIFTNIYNTNQWKSPESVSGRGSEITQTQSLIKDLELLFNEMKITSVLDIPCGDFNWMQKVDFSKIDYTGADIVNKLIQINKKKYKNGNNLKFKVLDIIKDPLPKSDIIIIRDCLVHLSYEDIFKAIKNVKLSGCKYLLTTTFTSYHSNCDILTGRWRRLNLQEKPFNFPNPILVINENCTEADGKYKDKSMALWEITKI